MHPYAASNNQSPPANKKSHSIVICIQNWRKKKPFNNGSITAFYNSSCNLSGINFAIWESKDLKVCSIPLMRQLSLYLTFPNSYLRLIDKRSTRHLCMLLNHKMPEHALLCSTAWNKEIFIFFSQERCFGILKIRWQKLSYSGNFGISFLWINSGIFEKLRQVIQNMSISGWSMFWNALCHLILTNLLLFLLWFLFP